MLKQRIITGLSGLIIFLGILFIMPQEVIKISFGILFLIAGWEWSHLIESKNVGIKYIFLIILAGLMLFINSLIIDYESFYNSSAVLEQILNINPSLIVLAGFLWKIPEKLIKAFPEKIINIHPALLPKFGGKGMYGINIHNAVIEKKETKSGITIHYVNKNYDEGEVIFQKTIDIKKNETPQELSSRILKLEHNFFPRIINQVLESGK